MLPLAQLPTAEIWDKYGLPGLVIGALFLTMSLLGRMFINQWKRSEDERNRIDDQRTKMFEGLIEQHRIERKEWREDADEARKENISALKEVASQNQQAIKEMSQQTVTEMKIVAASVNTLQSEVLKRLPT